jgi:hypothetical protein
MRHTLIAGHRRFGTIYRTHLHGSKQSNTRVFSSLNKPRTVLTLADGTDRLSPNVGTHLTTPRNMPDKRTPHVAQYSHQFLITTMVFRSPTNMLPSGSVLQSGGKTSSYRDSSLRRGYSRRLFMPTATSAISVPSRCRRFWARGPATRT